MPPAVELRKSSSRVLPQSVSSAQIVCQRMCSPAVHSKILGVMSQSTEELEAKRQNEAIRAVWAGTLWIPKGLLGKLARVDDALVDRWLDAHKLFSLQLDGNDYLPRYAFDERWQPLDAIRQVIHVFGVAYSSLALAMWFETPSVFLDNAKPRDLITEDAQLLVACAQDCLSNEHYAG
jgi:hypothetical protein